MTWYDRLNGDVQFHHYDGPQGSPLQWNQAAINSYEAANRTRIANGFTIPTAINYFNQFATFTANEITKQEDGLINLAGMGYQVENAVKHIEHTPCEDKWSLLVELALPAMGDALYLMLVPDPRDILLWFLHPKHGRFDRRYGREADAVERDTTEDGRIRRLWGDELVPDTNKLVAHSIPGYQAIAGRDIGAAERWFWSGIDVGLEVGWFWLLADVGETFITHWTSGIMEARFCSRQFSHLLELNVNGDYYTGPNFNVPPSTYATQKLATSHAFLEAGQQVWAQNAIPQDQQLSSGSGYYALDFKTDGSVPPKTAFTYGIGQLRASGSPPATFIDQHTIYLDPHSSYSISASCDLTGYVGWALTGTAPSGCYGWSGTALLYGND